MTRLFKGIHNYKGYFGGEAHCEIEIYENNGKAVVIMTESPDNQGTSVTNMSEHIAMQIKKEYLKNGDQVIWTEHYSHPPTKHRPEGRDDWSWVVYNNMAGVYFDPHWKPVDLDWVEQQIKEVEGEKE